MTRQGTTLPISNGSAERIKVVQGSVLLQGKVMGVRTLCSRTSNELSGTTRAKRGRTETRVRNETGTGRDETAVKVPLLGQQLTRYLSATIPVTHYTSQSTAYLAKGQGGTLTGSPHTISWTNRPEEVPRLPASQQLVNCRTIRVLYFNSLEVSREFHRIINPIL